MFLLKDKCVERKAPKKRKTYALLGTLQEYFDVQEDEEDSQVQQLLLADQAASQFQELHPS